MSTGDPAQSAATPGAVGLAGDVPALAGFREPPRFVWPVRVYWEDTDGSGVVYHARYLVFLERCRSEWLRALGIDQGGIRERERVQFAVVGMNVRWKRAARYDELLTVTAELADCGGATLGFRQQVLRGDQVLLEAEVRVAAVDADGQRPRRLPRAIVERL